MYINYYDCVCISALITWHKNRMYEVLPKNSENLNSAPEPFAIYSSAARRG
jgi:hypothetical protein